jgi:ATP-dependent Clp protease ATP-binding subunit ClpX
MATKLSPKAIYDHIDKFVIGQERAKKVVSNTLFLHAIRTMKYYSEEEPKPLKKSNAILLGPSGSGKTYLVEKGVEALHLLTNMEMWPMLTVDASNLTATGYVGDDLQDLLSYHYFNTIPNKVEPGHVPLAFATSVVFLDEIDKLCTKIEGNSGDISRQAQYNILKIVEGTDIVLQRPGDGRKYGQTYDASSQNMLFIFAGNFPQIRAERDKKQAPTMGFTEDQSDDIEDVYIELEKAGLATQLVGRISAHAELETLTKKELKKVLTETEDNILDQYKDLLEYIGYEFEISPYHINKIVNECYEKKTGARGLQAALDEFMEDIIFDMETTL